MNARNVSVNALVRRNRATKALANVSICLDCDIVETLVYWHRF